MGRIAFSVFKMKTFLPVDANTGGEIIGPVNTSLPTTYTENPYFTLDPGIIKKAVNQE